MIFTALYIFISKKINMNSLKKIKYFRDIFTQIN